MYPRELVEPMKKDLTQVGFQDLKDTQEVQEFIKKSEEGTSLVVVNSVCGCAAGACRPGVKKALSNSTKKPTKLVTVFAGVDTEATHTMRQHLLPYPASSPSIALFKEGELVHFIERHHIEGRSADMIAAHLEEVFEEYC